MDTVLRSVRSDLKRARDSDRESPSEPPPSKCARKPWVPSGWTFVGQPPQSSPFVFSRRDCDSPCTPTPPPHTQPSMGPPPTQPRNGRKNRFDYDCQASSRILFSLANTL
eukprot:JP447523.1.p3 GENE.JP447523.1~~JP447523.1.p3  ORF type:complete len:110 (-),score=3.74 JP447523.1:210-539(-)